MTSCILLQLFVSVCLPVCLSALLLYGASGTRKTGKIVPFLTDCLVFCVCNVLSLATVLCVGKPFVDSVWWLFFSLRCSIMYCNGRGHRCALGARKNKSTVCLPACLSACLPACLPVCLSVCLSVGLSRCSFKHVSITIV